MRLIDADKLKEHYKWWENSTSDVMREYKTIFDGIIDIQPTLEFKPCGVELEEKKDG